MVFIPPRSTKSIEEVNMKLVVLAVILAFAAYATATDYEWGQANPDDDYLIADDKVKKHSWLFNIPEKDYSFKQKKDDRLTITGMSITDPKGKCKAIVTITKGGPGYNYVKMKFVGVKRGKSFSCKLKIYGKQ